jgi:hypothetical protein
MVWNLQLKAVCNCTHSTRIEYVWIEAEMFSMASQFSEEVGDGNFESAVANSQQDDNREPEVNFAEPSITGGAGQAQLDALFLSTLVSWLHQFSSQSRCTQNIRIVRSSGTPTISFDFCYAKSVPERADPKDIFRPSFALS